MQTAAREMSRQAALRVRAVAAFAATRPASVDRAQGERGAMSAERWAARADVLRPVSEWAAQELSIALDISTQKAEAELERALTLVSRLPRVLEALEAGLLHTDHLWCLLEHVAPIADDALRARVEGEVLDWVAARRRVTTPAALGDRVRRVVAALNARDAARDLARALARRGISVREDRTLGMSVVTVVCSTPEAQAFYRALGGCVDALQPDPGDSRTRGQRLVDCLMDLVLRPGEGELPPVQALLTVVASVHTALGGDQLGEVDGAPVPAEMARQLVRALAGLDPTPTPTDAADAADIPTGGTVAVGAAGGADAADAQPAATPSIGAVEPVDVEGDPIERAARELSGADFDWWLDELVRHGFGDAPAPGDPGWQPGVPPGPAEWDAGPWCDPCEWLDAHAHDLPVPDAGAPPHTDGCATTPGAGWWAAADRAVQDAGAAVHTARLALGAAERTVRTARRADVDDEAAWQVSPTGRVTAAGDALAALAAADTQREELAALLDATGGGGLADRPRIAVTDAVTGALLALTDLPGLRRAGHCGRPACRRRPQTCGHDLTGRPGLGAPGPTDGYRPGAALERHVRARDRRCRFPGCRRRIPAAGELDHVIAHPHGPTAAANLAGFCTPDHRGKHQAPGWAYAMTPDGTLTVTTPSGLTAVTDPRPTDRAAPCVGAEDARRSEAQTRGTGRGLGAARAV
ncbi:HNH endonuclease signature motif containing protein [Geodermatophilus siccatus]|uniref:HNH endonuclease signature motif containing protein n=1 Tax=Geodermatophilus siccatus TaxID=1137991 RepID=UPI001FE03305|nr:HNH endonuclease signature motif containing protein [Geodermatophilus siccatus]